jgi:hypothetical protein
VNYLLQGKLDLKPEVMSHVNHSTGVPLPDLHVIIPLKEGERLFSRLYEC